MTTGRINQVTTFLQDQIGPKPSQQGSAGFVTKGSGSKTHHSKGSPDGHRGPKRALAMTRPSFQTSPNDTHLAMTHWMGKQREAILKGNLPKWSLRTRHPGRVPNCFCRLLAKDHQSTRLPSRQDTHRGARDPAPQEAASHHGPKA
jgi:hypothetical protein